MLKRCSYLLMSFLIVYAKSAYAFDLNAATMLDNLTQSIPDLMRLVTAIAYVTGMFFVIKGLVEFKHYGEQKSTHSTRDHGLKSPIIYMSIGALLLYLPTSVHVGLSSFWGSPMPIAYVDDSTDAWSVMINDAFMIFTLIGTFAFIRGLVMASRLSESVQQGTLGRAITHIIGGIFCINMYQVITMVMNTFAIGQS